MKGTGDMKVSNSSASRPVVTSLLASLLCCVPTGNQPPQVLLGTAGHSTGPGGQAAAVSGFAGGSAVAVADTGVIVSSGGEAEASAMETAVAATTASVDFMLLIAISSCVE